MCILFGQQLCFLSAVKHKNDVSDVIVRTYSFMKEIKLYRCTLQIVWWGGLWRGSTWEEGGWGPIKEGGKLKRSILSNIKLLSV